MIIAVAPDQPQIVADRLTQRVDAGTSRALRRCEPTDEEGERIIEHRDCHWGRCTSFAAMEEMQYRICKMSLREVHDRFNQRQQLLVEHLTSLAGPPPRDQLAGVSPVSY